ncbi:hypothetical protein C2G38_2209107 [Gigaspora rosea]|uniref:Retrotransposon gag domain-containing protein n=1 Tax=Gigaspora rosea TaxID=44941 RepID=A0A397UGG9_9GLOM|nr:hypothetical protein C2G38_2209107 [Gigaspora rosea]
MSYNQNPDPYIELATQIASLVQQLQVPQTLQVNISLELNTIPYPEFVEETQDPILWLDEIENAFEANLVQEACKIPIIAAKLKGPAATWWRIQRKANWFQKLTQRKQLIGENVDEYYVEKANLIRRLEIGGYCFPEVTKVQHIQEQKHAYEYYSLCMASDLQPINHFSQPSYFKAPTRPIVEEDTYRTIEVLDKLTYLINTMTNQVSYQEQPCQPQPTTHDSSNNRSLYKFSSFAVQTCSYTTSLANYQLSEQVTSVTNYAQRTDGPYSQNIHPTLSNSINNPRLPNDRNNLPLFSSYPKSLSSQVDKLTFQKFVCQDLRTLPIRNKSLNSKIKPRISQSKDHIDLKQQKLKKPKNRIDPYSIIVDIKNQAANITCGQLLTIKNNGRNKVSKGKEVDNYYFGEYNNTRRSPMGKSGAKKETNKEVPCKIDVEMSEPSGKGKSIKTIGVKEKERSMNKDVDRNEEDDSDNKTIIGEEIETIKDKKVNNGKWEERVKKFLEIESEGFKNRWEDKEQTQGSKMDFSSKLAISRRDYEEETETIRGLQIRTFGRFRL